MWQNMPPKDEYKRIIEEALHLRVYSDASFASNENISSQFEYTVLFCDETWSFHVLYFASKKAKCVQRSIVAGELYAFIDVFDAQLTIVTDHSQNIEVSNSHIYLHRFETNICRCYPWQIAKQKKTFNRGYCDTGRISFFKTERIDLVCG